MYSVAFRYRVKAEHYGMGEGSFLEDIESLWIDMYERGFVEESDVEHLQGTVL